MFRSIIVLAFIFSSPCFSAYQWGFGNLSLNYLDWDDKTESKSAKRDFTYLEIEGGAQFDWGELYGFFDLENLGEGGDLFRTASKGVMRYYIAKTPVSVYAHVYDFHSLGFSEQNRVLGLGYQFTGEGWWFKPFLGVHHVSQTYFSGTNGFMGGWIIGYAFKVKEQSFLATNWHEWEFSRDKDYAAGNGNKKQSQNGAAALWWNTTPDFGLGIQWRYARDKLGTAGGMNAAIFTIKYNL